jgi:protoheme ferro-lyase
MEQRVVQVVVVAVRHLQPQQEQVVQLLRQGKVTRVVMALWMALVVQVAVAVALAQ